MCQGFAYGASTPVKCKELLNENLSATRLEKEGGRLWLAWPGLLVTFQFTSQPQQLGMSNQGILIFLILSESVGRRLGSDAFRQGKKEVVCFQKLHSKAPFKKKSGGLF